MPTLHKNQRREDRACILARFFPPLCLFFLTAYPALASSQDQAESLLSELVASEKSDPASSNLLETVIRIEKAIQLSGWISQSEKVPQRIFQEVLPKHPQWSLLDTNQVLALKSAEQAKARLFPQVGLSADYGLRSFGSSPLTRAPGNEYTSSQGQLTFRQLLFDFGATWRQWKAAERSSHASCLRVGYQRSEFLLTTVEPIQNLQRTELLALWTSVLLQHREQTVLMMRSRFDEGAGTIYEIARAELKRAELARQKLDVDGQIRRLEVQNRLNGFNNRHELPVVWLPPVEQQMSTLGKHPLLEEARLAVEAATLEAQATSSRRLPQISLDLSLAGQRYEGTRSGDKADYSALVTLSYPLFDGGMTSSRVDEALARLEQKQLDLDQRLRTLTNLESQSLTDIAIQTETLLTNKRSLKSAVQTFAASKELFRVKRADLQEIQRIEDELYAEGIRLINTWFDLSISTYRYLHLTGRLLGYFGLNSGGCEN